MCDGYFMVCARVCACVRVCVCVRSSCVRASVVACVRGCAGRLLVCAFFVRTYHSRRFRIHQGRRRDSMKDPNLIRPSQLVPP